MGKISILGGGAWATALANLLADENDVLMYVRNEDRVAEINTYHTNHKYLPGAQLRQTVFASSDLKAVVAHSDIVLNAIPTQQTRTVLQEAKEHFGGQHVLINVSKGIERGSYLRISEIVEEIIPQVQYAVLSGPSHAEEVIKAMPTTVVIASKDIDLTLRLQDVVMRRTFRVYTGDDVIGVELGGAVKNILALGIGIADGLRYGDNPKAAMLTRGVHEMAKFGIALGGQSQTLYGLAGLGDLIVTATSRHSRNRNGGELLGQGYSLKETQQQIGQVIEGVMTCEAVYELSQNLDIEMPITQEIYRILYEGATPSSAVENLMTRERKQEFDY